MLKATHAGGYSIEIVGPAGHPLPSPARLLLPDLEPRTVEEAQRRVRAQDPALSIRIALPSLETVFLAMLESREPTGEVSP